MLEVINGFLMIYFVILCTISALIPHLVKPISSCFSRPSNDERNIWSELAQLKADQKRLSLKDDFAAYSRLQRKIIKIESELKSNSQARMSKALAVKGSVNILLQAIIALLMLFSVFWFRNEPVVVLKGDLFPLETMLRYPSDKPNAISTHVWVLVSNVAIRSLIKPLIG